MNPIKSLLILLLLALFGHNVKAQHLIVFNDSGFITAYYSTYDQIKNNYPKLAPSVRGEKAVLFLVEAPISEKGTFLIQYELSNNQQHVEFKNDTIIKTESSKTPTHKYYLKKVFFEEIEQVGFKQGKKAMAKFMHYKLIRLGENVECEKDSLKIGEIGFNEFTKNSKKKFENHLSQHIDNVFKSNPTLIIDFVKTKNQLTMLQDTLKNPNTYNSPQDMEDYLSNKKKLQDELTYYTNFYTTYYNENSADTPQREEVLDSIHSKSMQLKKLEKNMYGAKQKDEALLKKVEKKYKTLIASINYKAVYDKFLKDEQLQRPPLDVLHTGTIRQNGVFVDIPFSYTQKPLPTTPFKSTGFAAPTSLPALTTSHHISPVLININGETYRNGKPTFTITTDFTEKITEADLETNNIQGLQKFDELTNLFTDNSIFTDFNDEFTVQVNTETRVAEQEKSTLRFEKIKVTNLEGIIIPLSVEYPRIDSIFTTGNFGFDYLFKIATSSNVDSSTVILYFKEKEAFKKLYTFQIDTAMANVDENGNVLRFEKLVLDIENYVIQKSSLEGLNLNYFDITESKNEDSYISFFNRGLTVKILTQNFNPTLKDTLPNYYDILKDPIDNIPALTKPKIMVVGETYRLPDKLTYNVSGSAKPKLDDYKITLNKKEMLATAQLPIVYKTYRFSFNTGLAITSFKAYNYTINSTNGAAEGTPFRVEENLETNWTIAPTIFFSVFPWKHNVYQKIWKRTWYQHLELNLGIDYLDKTLLDNIYLGGGFAVHRLVHVSAGYKFQLLQRLDYSKIDPFTVTAENIQNNTAPEWNAHNGSFYFAINLGIDFIPSIISTLF